MRIAILADFPVRHLPGFEAFEGDGHGVWLSIFARALEDQAGACDIHWICCTKAVRKPREVRVWGQTFHLLPRTRLSWQMATGFRAEIRAIHRVLETIRPDLVHAWGSEQGYGLAAADWPGERILSMQGILQECCRVDRMHPLTRWQARHERKLLAGWNGLLTAESPWALEKLAPLAPQATLAQFEYAPDPACYGMERNPEETPLVLFVGTLYALKGVDTLLEAFRAPALDHVRLVLLGQGPLMGSLTQDNVSWEGQVGPAQVREWMSRAWCLALPTRADSSPNVVKEARVIGLPVITTPDGGQVQYVTHRQSGWIHQAGDVESLRHGILHVCADPERSRMMGQHGREECRQKLDLSAMVTRWMELIYLAKAAGKTST
jgi:glycosyltransferase involved in cell wall biosynthesis